MKQLISEKVDEVKVAKDQPQMALSEYFPAFYFGKDHPYGWAMNGDELSLPKLTRATVAEHWKRSFVGKNLVVVVAGDVNAKTMEAQLKGLFGKLPAGAAFVAKNAGASSTLQVDRLPGTISIVTFTKTESTEAAINLALKQLETINQLSGMLTDFEIFGLNRGEVDDLISRNDAATLEQVNQTAKKYYKTSGRVFVLIGDAAKIGKTAEKYAKDVRVVKISEPGF